MQVEWVKSLRDSYLAGGASMYILHGNVADVVGNEEPGGYVAEPLPDYLTRKLFGSYDLVLHYDLGRGLRAFAASDAKRLTQMNALLARVLGERVELPRDPTQALRVIDRLIALLLVGAEPASRKLAVLIDYADMLCPAEDRAGEHLATLLNWARSPVIRKVNIVFILMTDGLARLHPLLIQSGHTEEVQVPLPNEATRRAFIEHQFLRYAGNAQRLAAMSAGLTLANLDRMLRMLTPAPPTAQPAAPDEVVKPVTGAQAPHGPAISPQADTQLTALKKGLIEAQVPGLLEFLAPSFTLDLVAGHTTAKERLANDAQLVREGHLDAVPMGYLICGPVGVGKTFLALCYAGTVGIPCVTIRNFRSKYVGETEANLERVLGVIRELGPVAVIIDEADAAVGNREAEGDSGTSARVFAQLASQMGDTRYRGRVIWFLLTCRPDLLPIDLKRQGRCEEHIPLFYPQNTQELTEMFLAMGKKAKIKLEVAGLPDLSKTPALSGADIESILTRARREAFLRNQPVDASLLEEILKNFRSIRGAAHELQWLAAVLESSDLRYLPPDLREKVQQPGAMEALTRRFAELEALGAG
ncbi:MAG: ATP-binding protein [Candidatus Hydrogenedentes bacterium]|nr:ATP-binding protein [Candidatus Hydrogenedentota bacterium]